MHAESERSALLGPRNARYGSVRLARGITMVSPGRVVGAALMVVCMVSVLFALTDNRPRPGAPQELEEVSSLPLSVDLTQPISQGRYRAGSPSSSPTTYRQAHSTCANEAEQERCRRRLGRL